MQKQAEYISYLNFQIMFYNVLTVFFNNSLYTMIVVKQNNINFATMDCAERFQFIVASSK